MSAEVAKLKKFQVLNEYHDRTYNPKVIIGLKLCQQTKDMGILKFIWELLDADIPQKSENLTGFAESQFSSGIKSRKIMLKGWLTILCILHVKCAWFSSQKHKIECLSSIIFRFHWVLKMGQISKCQKWVENPFLKSYIF